MKPDLILNWLAVSFWWVYCLGLLLLWSATLEFLAHCSNLPEVLRPALCRLLTTDLPCSTHDKFVGNFFAAMGTLQHCKIFGASLAHRRGTLGCRGLGLILSHAGMAGCEEKLE